MIRIKLQLPEGCTEPYSEEALLAEARRRAKIAGRPDHVGPWDVPPGMPAALVERVLAASRLPRHEPQEATGADDVAGANQSVDADVKLCPDGVDLELLSSLAVIERWKPEE